jgi:hypothetical protein
LNDGEVDDMVAPPLGSDLIMKVISSLIGGDAGLLDGVSVAKTCFMIKARSDHDDFLDLFSIRRF